MKVTDIKIEAENFISLVAEYPPYPAQPPVPVSQRDLSDFVKPDPAVYSETKPWPEPMYQVSPVGIKSGFRLVTVSLFPVKFDPSSSSYLIATRLRVKVDYGFDASAEQISLTPKQVKVFSQGVKLLVANPEDVSRYAPSERLADFGTYDYCIITDSIRAPYFQRLLNWRTRTGYSGIVKTVSWITANYSGRDRQEKIRNFIRDYYNNYGLIWVLLGGDTAIVPVRRARTYCAGDTGNIPCDLYYGDLQWSWDSDKDNIFGEYGEDTTDLYYEVYIGRASVDDTTQVKTFVNKVITHETSPPTGYLRRILLVDDSLWSGYAYRQSNESISSITPSGWSDVFIHDPGNTTMVRDSLNNGFQFSHMVGHGNETGIYHTMPAPSYAFYSNSVISGHNNGSKVGLINSIACHPGNFEYSDCLAEQSHNFANGGALAVIMNSRYGWGTPPVIGPSEKLDVRFYDFFFNHDTMPIGLTHAESKEVYRGSANGGNGAWRGCYFELNLLGDPLLLMYKNEPDQRLHANFPRWIYPGSQNFTVIVDTFYNIRVANSLVCVTKDSEVYVRGYTNENGEVTFTINPLTFGFMYVTASKPDCLPDIDSTYVSSTQWSEITHIPGQVKEGGWLTYNSDNGLIYAARGYKSGDFYCYEPFEDEWTRLDGWPGGREVRLPYKGSAGCYGGGFIYALKGSNTCEFWRYDIANNSWIELDPMPEVGSSGREKRVRGGGNITCANGMLYAFKGGKTAEFWLYLPSSEEGNLNFSSPRQELHHRVRLMAERARLPRVLMSIARGSKRMEVRFATRERTQAAGFRCLWLFGICLIMKFS